MLLRMTAKFAQLAPLRWHQSIRCAEMRPSEVWIVPMECASKATSISEMCKMQLSAPSWTCPQLHSTRDSLNLPRKTSLAVVGPSRWMNVVNQLWSGLSNGPATSSSIRLAPIDSVLSTSVMVSRTLRFISSCSEEGKDIVEELTITYKDSDSLL